MQYLMMQQQQRGYDMGGSVPISPFGIKRSGRKLRTIE